MGLSDAYAIDMSYDAVSGICANSFCQYLCCLLFMKCATNGPT